MRPEVYYHFFHVILRECIGRGLSNRAIMHVVPTKNLQQVTTLASVINKRTPQVVIFPSIFLWHLALASKVPLPIRRPLEGDHFSL